MKTNAFFILFLICIGLSHKFEERPPIKKEQCPVEIQEIKYDLVFFIKLEGVHKYKPKVEELNIFSKKLVALLDEIKEPNKLLLDIIENPKKESPYVVKYDENIKPDDIEAIKHYKILVEFEQKYQRTIDFYGTLFLQFFEKDVNTFLSSLDKINSLIDKLKQYTIDDIQHELVQLQRDFKTCTGNQFHLVQQSIKFKDVTNKKRKNHKKHKINKKQNHQTLVQNLETQFIQWKFVEYEPVKKEECGQFMEEIEQDFLEFLKIQELVKYRRHKQAYTDSVNQLYEQKEDYVRLAKIISKAKHSLRFDNSMIIRGAFRYYLELGLDNQFKGYNKDYSLANDAIGYLDQTYNDLNDLKSTFDKPSTLLGVDLETFEFFKLKNEILNNYIDKTFSYQDEEVYHELLQINKDYKICEGKKDYGKYIFKIQNEQQVNKKEQKKEYILDPPIQKQNCQKQLPDIKENILYYLKHNVVRQFGLLIPYYEKIMQDINNLQDNILTNNKQLNNFFKDLKLETTLIFIQQIQSNSNPDDLKVIKAYDNLNSLNNYLSINQNIFLAYLKKNYFGAVPFLKITESDFSTLNKQFNNLNTIIDYQKYQAQDIQKELQESLRDYTICTDKDFLKEYNLEIQDRSQDNFSYSFNQDKNKFIKPVYGLINQNANLLQLNQDWKYQEYPPIQKHECKEELPIIIEDIRQFQKIQVLSRYKIDNQKSYDILIEKVLNMKEEFLKNAKQGYNILSKLDFSRRLRMFNDYPKNYKSDKNADLLNGFDKIHEYINNLGTFDKQQSEAILLYLYDDESFKTIQQSQLLLNDYLNNKFNYNMNEVELELKQLYRDYEICNGRSYFDNNQNQRHHFHPKAGKGQPRGISQPILRARYQKIHQEGKKPKKQNNQQGQVLKQNPKHKQKRNNKQKLQLKQNDK